MAVTKLKVIPMPKEVYGEDKEGNFKETSINAVIYTEYEKFKNCIQAFKDYALKIHNITFGDDGGGIEVFLDEDLKENSYRIECEKSVIMVYAQSCEGISYALSTLLQIISEKEGILIFPRVKIVDNPDCKYRSLMVDLARQWHEFECLYKYVDLCYLYKIKYLHLHFVDTQSYTLPSNEFPEISTNGRHYTREQIAQLNDYALSRNVELIPEIELPAHAAAMINAYPELFANKTTEEGTESDPTAFKSHFKNNIICVGKPGVMENIKKLIVEITEMFPNSQYLHIGGDEAEINEWNNCCDCKKYMREHKIKNVRALYSHFIKQITDMVLSIGRTPIVWEGFPKEGAEEISRDILVIAWESYYHMAYDLVEEGFDIVNASWQPLYIVPHRKWSVENIMAWNIYNWQHWWPKSEAHLNPIHIQPTNKVKGAQLCAWECNYDQAIEPIAENLAALSERTWNIKRYAENEEFREKLNHVLSLVKRIIG